MSTKKAPMPKKTYAAPTIDRVGSVAELTRTIKDVGASDGFTNAQGQDIGVLS